MANLIEIKIDRRITVKVPHAQFGPVLARLKRLTGRSTTSGASVLIHDFWESVLSELHRQRQVSPDAAIQIIEGDTVLDSLSLGFSMPLTRIPDGATLVERLLFLTGQSTNTAVATLTISVVDNIFQELAELRRDHPDARLRIGDEKQGLGSLTPPFPLPN